MFKLPLHSLLLALLTTVSASTLLTLDVSVLLRTQGPASINSIDDFKVTTTLTNAGREPVKLLNDPRSPISPAPGDSFTIVNHRGDSPTFVGMIVRYVPEVAAAMQAYTILSPGESLEVEHDLLLAYDFSLSGAGHYTVHPNRLVYVVNQSNSSQISTVYADTSSHHTRLSEPMTPATPAIGIKFQGCSSTQRRSIAAAARGAQTYASDAYSSARASPRSARYITWFGSWTLRRHLLVVSHFRSIKGNKFSDFTYDCSCSNKDWFAYVYPNEYGIIHLCPLFWTIHTVGIDSQAGTLVHEASHFNRNGGTDDFPGAYGLDGARRLARTRPDKAVMNAENHMYFAENAP
ncbi:zincin [Agrocybe pediades]|nr:zincin [Agrocybe pediades]